MFAAVIKFFTPSQWLAGSVRLAAVLFCVGVSAAHADIEIIATRIWPAQDYTRLTLESRQAIRHNMFLVTIQTV